MPMDGGDSSCRCVRWQVLFPDLTRTIGTGDADARVICGDGGGRTAKADVQPLGQAVCDLGVAARHHAVGPPKP